MSREQEQCEQPEGDHRSAERELDRVAVRDLRPGHGAERPVVRDRRDDEQGDRAEEDRLGEEARPADQVRRLRNATVGMPRRWTKGLPSNFGRRKKEGCIQYLQNA